MADFTARFEGATCATLDDLLERDVKDLDSATLWDFFDEGAARLAAWAAGNKNAVAHSATAINRKAEAICWLETRRKADSAGASGIE